MLAEDKEKFVDIILINDSGDRKKDDIRYYMLDAINNLEISEDAEYIFNSGIQTVIWYDKESPSNLSGTGPFVIKGNYYAVIVAASVNFNNKLIFKDPESNKSIALNIFDALRYFGLEQDIDIINSIPTITEEEFINLVKQ